MFARTTALAGLLVVPIAALMMTGCSDNGDEPPHTQGIYDAQIQPIFTARCVNAGCHPGGGAPFSLQTGASYNQIVNVPATGGPCAGMPRVKPASADSSVLYRRISGTTCGSRMPQGTDSLSAAEQTRIRDWINAGARFQ